MEGGREKGKYGKKLSDAPGRLLRRKVSSLELSIHCEGCISCLVPIDFYLCFFPSRISVKFYRLIHSEFLAIMPACQGCHVFLHPAPSNFLIYKYALAFLNLMLCNLFICAF